uniref:Uncharacterized protein n=1 Tax=Myoviridae sp. ctshb19 TaxID=2825194 RepID=A0A8S5UGX4_9CAUD|nr:MAG TPA: hypothetical protein [Myoviridae sp. ctshb19]
MIYGRRINTAARVDAARSRQNRGHTQKHRDQRSSFCKRRRNNPDSAIWHVDTKRRAAITNVRWFVSGN